MSIFYRAVPLALFLLVYIVGLVGNGLLIFIVFRQKNLRTVPNLLVVSLALGDFFFVLFCVPFGAVAYAVEYYPFPTFYCRFENFIINLSLGVSVFSLLALSADRYNIIVTPFSSHTNDPSIKLKTTFISIWLLSILLALPETFYSGLIKENFLQANNQTIELIYCWSPNHSDLLSDHRFMITRQILRLIIYYLMPLVFISIFYILIARHLFQAKNVIFTPTAAATAAQPFLNHLHHNKRLPLTHSNSTKQLAKLSLDQNSNPYNNNNNNNNILHYRANSPRRSATLDNEHYVNRHGSYSLASSLLSNQNLRRSKDFLDDNGVKTRLNMHTLYRNAKTRKQLQARRKVAKTVLFLCSVFFICWLPKQIHDLYWFIGVIIYSARWNHFWQINKTLALILSYVYSCINPFALYFLSSTFRHFYKRYLFFWKNHSCCCHCYSEKSLNRSLQARRIVEGITISEGTRRSSANNVSTIYTEINRMRVSSFYPQSQNPIRLGQSVPSQRTSVDSVIQVNGQSI